MMANRSPPTPSFIGAISPIIALAATAASTALPPFSRILAPTSEASTLSLATMPDCDITIERDCERSCAHVERAADTHNAATPMVVSFGMMISLAGENLEGGDL